MTLTVIPDQVFVQSGVGDNVFDIPSYVGRVRIQGTYPGRGENFIVWIAGRLVVNEIIGNNYTPSTFDGTYVVSRRASKLKARLGCIGHSRNCDDEPS